jgi:hypothetical protein
MPTRVLDVRELRWAFDHHPVPTPPRGTFVQVDAPPEGSSAGGPVEVRVDLRKVGEIEWVYEGPVLIDQAASGADDPERFRAWLREALGPRCVEVRVGARDGQAYEVLAFVRGRDMGRPH